MKIGKINTLIIGTRKLTTRTNNNLKLYTPKADTGWLKTKVWHVQLSKR